MAISTINLIVFKIGPVPCCVDSNSVQVVIEPPQHITAIPGSNALRPGLFSYMKKTVAVYDVRSKFSMPTDQRGKILITNINQRQFGFWVDSIQEIVSSDKGRWQAMPAECPKEIFDGILLHNKQLVLKTDFKKLAIAEVSTQTQLFIKQFLQPEKDDVIQDNDDKSTQTEIQSKAANSDIAEKEPKEENSTAANIDNSANHQVTDSVKASPQKITKPASINKADSTSSTDSQIRPSLTPNTGKTLFNPAVRTTQKDKTTAIPSPSYEPANKPVVNKQVSPPKTTISSIPTQTLTSPIDKEDKIKPASTFDTAQAHASKTPEKEKSTGLHWQADKKTVRSRKNLSATILLLLITSSALSLYFIYFNTATSPKKTAPPVLSGQNTNDINSPADDLVTNLPVNTRTSPASDESQLAVTDGDNIKDEVSSNLATSIRKEKNTIIITIDDSEAAFKTIANKEKPESILPASKTEPQVNDTGKNLATVEKNPEAKTTNKTPETKLKKITHIVIKGDTLWHIAKRYIRDPFKYKQIAKLSKIKNPDRIYPGNKIIIIIKK